MLHLECYCTINMPSSQIERAGAIIIPFYLYRNLILCYHISVCNIRFKKNKKIS